MDHAFPEPSVPLLDRDYGFENVRKTVEVQNVVPIAAMRQTDKPHSAVDRRLQVPRNLGRRYANRPMRTRRLTSRCAKTVVVIAGFVGIELIRLRLRHPLA